ncbi:Uncharacterised protein [Mycobacteroides abscessus subsp. abscessus]|nr:Uncharacterised protein [Mycobacteroides abscessus subsp. abscessus]
MKMNCILPKQRAVSVYLLFSWCLQSLHWFYTLLSFVAPLAKAECFVEFVEKGSIFTVTIQ